MQVVGLIVDLMDRSRITAAIPDAKFASTPGAIRDAEIVVIDLSRGQENVGIVRTSLPDARIVAYGPHVDENAMQSALEAGADGVFPRSKFFRDVAEAVFGNTGGS